MFINRPRDIKLAASALTTTAASGGESAQDLLARRFPDLLEGRDHDTSAIFAFSRDETHIVIDALRQRIGELKRRPIARKRASSLIGELVVQADTKLVNL